MQSLKRLYYHFVRWPRSHGFGIQSPSDFNFVLEVVRQRYPYYAYSVLAEKYPEDYVTRTFHQFLLRLSNMVQGQYWVSNNLKTVELDYLRAGCNKASLFSSHPHPDGVILDLSNLQLPSDFEKSFYHRYVDALTPNGVLVVEGIHESDICYRFWKQIVDDTRAITSFDIYDVGVVFFDLKKPKNHYNITFRL